VAASHHDATLNNGATPYTTSVDSTRVLRHPATMSMTAQADQDS